MRFFKQFIEVIRFEITGFLTMSSFRIVTAIIIIAIGLLLSLPSAVDFFKISSNSIEEKGTLAIYNHVYDSELIQQLFKEKFKNREIVITSSNDVEVLKQLVEDGAYNAAIVFTDPCSYIYIVKGTPLIDNTELKLEEIISLLYYNMKLSEQGISSIDVNDKPVIQVENISVGKSNVANLFYTLIFLFFMYCVIIIYSNLIISSIINEKSSHTVEVLITSVKPEALIFGKVISASIIGIFQLLIIISTSLFFYQLNKVALVKNVMVNMIFSFPPALIGYLVLFFILGFLLYFFIFATFASSCTQIEEANNICSLVTYAFVFLFTIIMFLMVSDIDGDIMRVFSFVPFTSPIAMFARIAMSSVTWWEIFLSINILIVSIIVIGFLTAKIYKIGMLLYGKTSIKKYISI